MLLRLSFSRLCCATRALSTATVSEHLFARLAAVAHDEQLTAKGASLTTQAASHLLQGSKLQKLRKNQTALASLLKSEADPTMQELLHAEIEVVLGEKRDLEYDLTRELFDHVNGGASEVIFEIRAGTGGAEAALFAGQLCELYKLYFRYKGWTFDVLSESATGAQTRETVMSVAGPCFSDLVCETGVHRVQRVPETDSQGRVHTSTVTIAALPQHESADDEVMRERDVRIDVYRSSGPGGQNVNKTNSAVRLVHEPTGTTVCMQDERSQIRNMTKAFKVLRYRLEQRARQHSSQSTKSFRAEQIGTGERSDKIRTYNFPQSRITDHRINYSAHNLFHFFRDPSVLDDIILQNKLHRAEQDVSSLLSQLDSSNKDT